MYENRRWIQNAWQNMDGVIVLLKIEGRVTTKRLGFLSAGKLVHSELRICERFNVPQCHSCARSRILIENS